MNKAGKLIIVSGPSGAGKSTLLEKVFRQSGLPLEWSVSATTRKPRPGEAEGRDYHFLSSKQFEKKRAAGEFLECFEVYSRGHWYGTLQSEVAPRLEAGNWVVLEIDVEGTMAVIERYPDAITIFVRPSSLEELGRRLKARGTESAEDIEQRIKVAGREMESIDFYRHVVINDDVEQATQQLCEILKQYDPETTQTH
ncbi:MAG: guanylate kinase [Planctomycetota bacterium]|nr:guanylate kinase [Planctomycetota bacterium]